MEFDGVFGSAKRIDKVREGRHGYVDLENPRSQSLRWVSKQLLLLTWRVRRGLRSEREGEGEIGDGG